MKIVLYYLSCVKDCSGAKRSQGSLLNCEWSDSGTTKSLTRRRRGTPYFLFWEIDYVTTTFQYNGTHDAGI